MRISLEINSIGALTDNGDSEDTEGIISTGIAELVDNLSDALSEDVSWGCTLSDCDSARVVKATGFIPGYYHLWLTHRGHDFDVWWTAIDDRIRCINNANCKK